MFVKTDGTLWGVGQNNVGQLGDGTTSTRQTPVRVATGVASVSAGNFSTMFVKTDGTLWGMGRNDNVQLGDGTTTSRSTPVRSAGGLQSNVAALTVNTPPVITTQLASQTVAVGFPINLTVVATGNPAPTYQWRKSGSNIPNATNASYTINSATTGDAGAYTVVVTNSVSSVTSNEAVVTVNPAAPAAITVQPTNVTANLGQSATLSVTVSGSPTPTIQWLKNSTVISGATNATYTISSVSQSDAATYSATVQNVYNGTTYSLTTSPAVLTVGFVTGDGFACTSDGSVIKITGYTGTATALTVPGTISGLPVTGLGASALQGKSLTSVSLPPSLVSIGSLAFGANPALSQIALPANLVSIGASAFIGCGLTSVLIPASVTSIGVETFVNNTLLGAINVEAGNPNYASVEGVLFDKNIVTLLQYPASRSGAYTIPTSVTTIGRSAFDRVASLTEITIPVGLTKLDTNAFFRCTSLKTVSIPSTVTSISVQPFAGCYSLTSINVDAANPKYAGVGGVLFDKALTTLIQFPGGLAGAYTIPTGVTKIGNGSFRGSALTQVFVPAGVATMEWGAFIESSNLQEIVFLGNAPTLVTPAVPSTLKRVYYLSTASGWTATFNGIATSPIPAPSIVTQPQNQTVARGATATFSVAISSVPAPTYQWYFNGSLAIAGATNASFSVPSAQVANQGPYNVRASTAAGEITSASATLTVNVPPVIATAPGNVTIPNGERTQLKVSASGANPLSYQWYQGSSGNISNPMAGATGATFTTAGLTATTSYWVRITDANGLTTDSPSATVTVSASSPLTVTQQVITAGYRSGEAVVVTNTITYTGTAPSRIDWSTLLPTGWKYLGSGGSEGGARPTYKNADLIEWSWTTVPPSPIEFTYTVGVPAGTTGDQVIASLVTSQAAGTNYQTMAKPDPLVVRSASLHSADSNRDGKISLTELTRVIELYNYRSGTTRTGEYKPAPAAGTEDGFAPGP
jgi:hypothetical protein